MKRLICATMIGIAGCGTIYPRANGEKFFTVSHGNARFGDVMQGAKEYCAKLGLTARHLGSDRLGSTQSLSRFECV